ncbi:hypothetical protein ART_3807 [Arthrobacter sp. PAMC 25486]|uniref:hypothetical protein n=1 Tax=Arthrobacter sp. PAMC 25486 TaxID=1494608 RepID=UPI000535AE27|nr:hypothetical protein [Arthrobacter sp. PAMC 25486]AIY03406.1 hypothetical protein ART_3807 [Arthrobacter sp. PAMC 25486]
MLGGGFKALISSRERAHERRVELYKLQHPEVAGLDVSTPKPAIDVAGQDQKGYSEADVAKVLAEHDAFNKRWLSYELDIAKLIDFPMMSDVREPLTVAFLRAKRDADALRPLNGAEIPAKSRWDDYRNAVNAFAVAFEVAEKEAHRIKDSAFNPDQRQRLGTAAKLIKIAENHGASPAERQTALKRVRRELDGVIVLPDLTIAALEQQVARMIAGPQ